LNLSWLAPFLNVLLISSKSSGFFAPFGDVDLARAPDVRCHFFRAESAADITALRRIDLAGAMFVRTYNRLLRLREIAGMTGIDPPSDADRTKEMLEHK
jgi:hypothetical protein